MTSQYLIKNIENPKIRYYIGAGYHAYTDLCKMYGLEAENFLSFFSKLESTREDVISFYDKLDQFNANPFNKE